MKKDHENPFSINEILGGNINEPSVQLLINTLKSMDLSYLINSPLDSDIEIPTDSWLSHSSKKLGINIEFVQDHLCYISFDQSKVGIEHSYTESGLIFKKDFECEWGKFVFYGSVKMFREGILPNRFVPLIEIVLELGI